MQTLQSLLAEHSFFQGMSESYLHLITGCASNVKFDRNEFVFHENEEAKHFYVLRHGRIRLEISAPPRPPVLIDTVDAGEVLGWSWLFQPYRWHFDAVASELTRAIAVDGECLRTKCENNRDLGYALAKRFFHLVEERLQATRLRLLDMYKTDCPQ